VAGTEAGGGGMAKNSEKGGGSAAPDLASIIIIILGSIDWEVWEENAVTDGCTRDVKHS